MRQMIPFITQKIMSYPQKEYAKYEQQNSNLSFLEFLSSKTLNFDFSLKPGNEPLQLSMDDLLPLFSLQKRLRNIDLLVMFKNSWTPKSKNFYRNQLLVTTNL